MIGSIEDPLTIYILIGCTVALLIILISCGCIVYLRRKNENKQKKFSLRREQESLEMDSLLFVYERTTENQQSPQRHKKYEAQSICSLSCPASPLTEKEYSMKKSFSYLELPGAVEESSFKKPHRRCSLNPDELDLRLYQTEEESIVSPYSGLGQLSLQLSYDKSNEKLIVYIHKGTNIQAKSNSPPSPYLKVSLLPDKKRRIHSKTRKGENPIFNEDFVFSVPQTELPKRILRIAVCDFDRFSRQNSLGYVVLPLQVEIEKLMELNGTGEIWKELSDNDAMPGLQKGELQFSLSYLPTAGRMTISVTKAKDLNVYRSKETGVAVKVNLVLNGKTVKSKKTSTTKLNITEPTFNESFVYEVSNDMLDRTSFVFIVYAYTNNSKRIIGKANTGPYMYSTGTGLSHWNDMLLQPRNAVSHWHKLM